MTRLLLATLFASQTAAAVGLELGVGAGLAVDLPDAASRAGDTRTTAFTAGALAVPVGLRFSDTARLRIEPRFDLGAGRDRVSWAYTVDGDPVRQFADGAWGGGPTRHGALLSTASLLFGGDFDLPVGAPVQPYLGALVGPTLAWTMHTWRDESVVGDVLKIRDDALYGSMKSDASTSQLTWSSELHLGARVGAAGGVAGWVETGYSVAFFDADRLSKTPESLDARREAFGWNPWRLTVGVQFPL